ncbi:MAG: hypothetical protein M1136_09720 [Chloroflexi bacterium]|nr:hypothetical protein [Chloroflexota bacterium]
MAVGTCVCTDGILVAVGGGVGDGEGLAVVGTVVAVETGSGLFGVVVVGVDSFWATFGAAGSGVDGDGVLADRVGVVEVGAVNWGLTGPTAVGEALRPTLSRKTAVGVGVGSTVPTGRRWLVGVNVVGTDTVAVKRSEQADMIRIRRRGQPNQVLFIALSPWRVWVVFLV